MFKAIRTSLVAIIAATVVFACSGLQVGSSLPESKIMFPEIMAKYEVPGLGECVTRDGETFCVVGEYIHLYPDGAPARQQDPEATMVLQFFDADTKDGNLDGALDGVAVFTVYPTHQSLTGTMFWDAGTLWPDVIKILKDIYNDDMSSIKWRKAEFDGKPKKIIDPKFDRNDTAEF